MSTPESPSRAAEAVPEQHIVFALGSGLHALNLKEISGVADAGVVRKVPRAPLAVLGLAEWRGRLITVIDLPHLLGERCDPGSASLLRLAPPLDHLAFFVPAHVEVRSLDTIGDPGKGEGGEKTPRILEPGDLLARIESHLIPRQSKTAHLDG